MDNLLLSFNVVAPLVVYMAVGFLLRRVGVISEKTCSQMSQIVMCVLTPVLCFESVRVLDLAVVFSDPFVLYVSAIVLVLFILAMILVPRFSKENRRRGVLVHSVFRSNDGVFALAVGTALLPPRQRGILTLCLALTIPLHNLLSVIDMEYFRGSKPDVLSILRRVVTNPVIVGCLFGIVMCLLGLDVPTFLKTPLSGFAGMCAPMGFLALGGTLTFRSVSENLRALTVVSILKLIVMPIAVLSVLYWMGYRDAELMVGLVIFGAPSALAVYPMACTMGGDEKLSAGVVAVTSTLSLLTMFLFIFLLKQLGVA